MMGVESARKASGAVVVEFPRFEIEDLNIQEAVGCLRAEIARLDRAISDLEKLSRVRVSRRPAGRADRE